MRMPLASYLITLALALAPLAGLRAEAAGSASGPDYQHQSYETCSLITSEYVTLLQLIQRGFDRKALAQALPGLSEPARERMEALYRTVADEGLVETYSAVNAEYARCARAVHDRVGQPVRTSRKGHFHFCAGENKVRYQVLMAAVVGGSAGEILPQLDAIHRPTAKALLQLYRDQGELAVFSALADELKHCINNNL